MSSINDDNNSLIGSLVLSKYRIIKEIGRGGMGLVYLAEDIRLGREVALKELVLSRTIQGRDRDDIISRFQREARTTSTLNHPNIVTIFDVGEDNKRHFIAMEYLPGKTLKDYLDQGYNFALEEILDILIQVSSALDHAHSKGVIHRDIKPDNIKVLQDNIVKIMDFGIAGLESKNSNLTQDGTILGTIAYISPEQLYNSKNVSSRADIFSLGVMMFEIFTRKLPFDGDTVGSTIMKIMGESPVRPSSINKQIPDKLEQVILKCLEKNPNQRMASARDLIQELLAYKISLSNRELHDPILSDDIASSHKLQQNNTYMSAFRMTAITTGNIKLGKYKLLYLEDDPIRQRIFGEVIKQEGLPFDWMLVDTVAEALQLLDKHDFDFLICDYMLKDGYANPVLDKAQFIPTIVVTSTSNPQTIINLMKKGLVDYILKSNAVDEVKKIVKVIQERTGDQFLAQVEHGNLDVKQSFSKEVSPSPPPSASINNQDYFKFVQVLGRSGASAGEFASPRWIFHCAYSDSLLIADTQNSRVQILDKQGHCLLQIVDEGMKAPCSVATDENGFIYVLDALDAQIRVFDSQGALIQSFGGKGNSPGKMTSAFGLALFNQLLYVTDPDGHRIHVFDLQGMIQAVISSDSGLGEFKSPSGICSGPNGVYILDHGLSQVRVLDQAHKQILCFGKRGAGKGDFSIPKGIAVDTSGNIYVTEVLSHRIQVFDAQGEWLFVFGKKGTGNGEFNNPESIAVDSSGNVFILDRGNHRIQVFIFDKEQII
jgi:serine/threonine protein kinase